VSEEIIFNEHFVISGFPLPMQVILRAIKKYGIILTDNGSDWYISGSADNLWDNDMLVAGFDQLQGSDFGPLMFPRS
jgi:hypothetical protein